MPDLDAARAATTARLNRIAAIENGALESNAELLSGMPFMHDSAERSAQAWIDAMIEDLDPALPHNVKIVAALKSLRIRFDHVRLGRVIKLAESAMRWEIVHRCLIYGAFVGGTAAGRHRVAAMCLVAIRPSTFDAPFYLATALGLATTAAASMSACRTAGFKALEQVNGTTSTLKEAAKAPEPEVEDDELMQAVLEDRAEYIGVGTTENPLRIRKKAQRPGAVVVPRYEIQLTTGRDDRGRVRKSFEAIAGKRLPFILTGDVADHLAALVARAPHLGELFAEMLLDTCASAHVRLRPWLLVGEPGSGKSWAAREFADVLGLPVSVFDAGASSDGAFAGTPAQWSSAGASHVLQLINSSGIANPLVVIDEADKAANSPANGSLHHALLTFLDPGSAGSIHDPGLEMPVDLSHVNYVLTANDLGAVPTPLRDRCRIVRVPNPGPEHVGVLVGRIVEDIARTRGMDPAWEPPFPPDEVEIIAEAWGGGSIRRLRQVVQSALNFRAQNMGSC